MRKRFTTGFVEVFFPVLSCLPRWLGLKAVIVHEHKQASQTSQLVTKGKLGWSVMSSNKPFGQDSDATARTSRVSQE